MRSLRLAALALFATLAACNGDPSASGPGRSIVAVSNAVQAAPVGSSVDLQFLATDNTGDGEPDVRMTFTLASGSGTLSHNEFFTDGDGFAGVTLTLSAEPGPRVVEARVPGVSSAARVTVVGFVP